MAEIQSVRSHLPSALHPFVCYLKFRADWISRQSSTNSRHV